MDDIDLISSEIVLPNGVKVSNRLVKVNVDASLRKSLGGLAPCTRVAELQLKDADSSIGGNGRRYRS